MHACMHVCMYLHVHTCAYIYIFIYFYIDIYPRVCVCIHTFIWRERSPSNYRYYFEVYLRYLILQINQESRTTVFVFLCSRGLGVDRRPLSEGDPSNSKDPNSPKMSPNSPQSRLEGVRDLLNKRLLSIMFCYILKYYAMLYYTMLCYAFLYVLGGSYQPYE